MGLRTKAERCWSSPGWQKGYGGVGSGFGQGGT